MLFHRMMGLNDMQACDGVVSPVPYAPFTMRTTEKLAYSLERAPAARALGCTATVTVAHLGDRGESPEEAENEGAMPGLRFQEVPDPLPAAFVPHQPRLVKESAVLASVLAADSAAEAIRILDDPLGRLGSGDVPNGSLVESVEVLWPARTKAMVSVAGHGAGIVGVRTSFLAGWSASQAGSDLPVIRVAGQQIGAVVPDVGRGPVIFEYRVPHLAPAAAVALAGVLLIFVAFRSVRRSERVRATG